jgi:hypothetical protein
MRGSFGGQFSLNILRKSGSLGHRLNADTSFC